MTDEEMAIPDAALDFYNNVRRLESCESEPVPLDQYRQEIAELWDVPIDLISPVGRSE